MESIIQKTKLFLNNAGGAALEFLARVLLAIVVYYLIRKFLDFFLRKFNLFLEKQNIESTARHFLTQLIRYGVLVLTLISIIIQLDLVEASSIAALIASAGVGISLAMQGALSNFAGGLLLLALRPFREGDYIVVNNSDVEGTVEKIELYYTTIRTLWGSNIMVPNSELTNNAVTNKSSDHRRALNIQVGISYRQDIRQAIKVLEQIKAEEGRIIPGEGRIGVSSLGESAVILTLQAPVNVEVYYDVLWDLNEKIRVRFADEGIEIPYNQLDVHIRKDEE